MNKEPEIQTVLRLDLSEEALRNLLQNGAGRPVVLVLTQNATSMLSARQREGVMHVRLHRIFLGSSPEVIEEICRFVRNGRGVMPHFRRFIRENRAQLGAGPGRRITARTAGRYYDLIELYNEINKDYFHAAIDAVITWGARSPRSSVRKRTLGSFSPRSNVIRINPVLDRKTIPRYYIAFVVYHEMLHAALGIAQKGDRRSMHSREFRRRERLFREYERARSWDRGEQVIGDKRQETSDE